MNVNKILKKYLLPHVLFVNNKDIWLNIANKIKMEFFIEEVVVIFVDQNFILDKTAINLNKNNL